MCFYEISKLQIPVKFFITNLFFSFLSMIRQILLSRALSFRRKPNEVGSTKSISTRRRFQRDKNGGFLIIISHFERISTWVV